MIAATSTSGHTAAVRATPIAAATTAQLPIRSLREHSHTDSHAESGGHLDHEHDQIDTKNDPQHASIRPTATLFYERRMAADFAHLERLPSFSL